MEGYARPLASDKLPHSRSARQFASFSSSDGSRRKGCARHLASHKLPPSPPPLLRELDSSSSSTNNLGTVSLLDGPGRKKLLKRSLPMEGYAEQLASLKLHLLLRELDSSSSSTNNLGNVSLLDGPGRKKLLKRSLPQGFVMDLLGILIKNSPHNYEFWCARMMVAGQLGVNNSTTKSNELKFTEEILLMFPRNKLAWSYRQWIFVQSGGAKNDLAFYDKILQDDSSNKFAWNQRLFLVTKFETEAVGEAEVELAIRSILDGPENECPWIYLRSLYINKVVTLFDYVKLDGLFASVIAFNEKVRLQPIMEKRRFGPECDRDLEINAIMNRKTLANALETLVCLTSYDYEIRTTVRDALRSACLHDGSMRIPDVVYHTLQFVDPLRAPYWKQRLDYVMEMRRNQLRGQISPDYWRTIWK